MLGCTNHPSRATDHRTRTTPHVSLAACYAARRHPERSEGSLSAFLQPLLLSFAIADSVATFTRSNGSTRTVRMLLINEPAIRIVRNFLKTNNRAHF
jgi:hypothetical protein